MSLKTSIISLAANLVPTQTRVIVRGRQQPPVVAHTLDVDALHATLRSAEQGYTDRLFALYRDIISSHAHTQAEFSKRKLAVLGQPFTLTSINPKDPAQEAHTQMLRDHLADRTEWIKAMSHALDSVLYPISLLERWYQLSDKPGWRYEIGGIKAVPHIHLAWPFGNFSIRDTDEWGVFTGTYLEPDPRLHFSHQGHLLASVPDWWGGPMRAILFWWLFATMDRDWWVRFLDRFGSPFLQGSYDPSDERGRYELESAFSAATKLFGIVTSNDTEVKLHQANTSQGGDAFEKFHSVANEEISKLIVGQVSSANTKNVGLSGSGQATAQADVRDDIRQYDSHALAATVKTQLLMPLWKINGWSMPMPHVSFGAIESKDKALDGQLISSLYTAGIELSDEGLNEVSRNVGFGLQRVAAPPAVHGMPSFPGQPGQPGHQGQPVALSASAAPLMPSVSRRAARQRQARGAVDALVRRASPKLARMMQARAEDFHAAILSADSPEAAASAIAALTAAYDPTECGQLIQDILTSAAVNAAIAS